MPLSVLAISWQCRALVASVTSASSLRRMGFRAVAIARGREKEKLAKELGAISYIDAQTEDPAATLQRMGRAKVILAPASSNRSMGPLIAGLAPRGRLIVAGAS